MKRCCSVHNTFYKYFHSSYVLFVDYLFIIDVVVGKRISNSLKEQYLCYYNFFIFLMWNFMWMDSNMICIEADTLTTDYVLIESIFCVCVSLLWIIGYDCQFIFVCMSWNTREKKVVEDKSNELFFYKSWFIII